MRTGNMLCICVNRVSGKCIGVNRVSGNCIGVNMVSSKRIGVNRVIGNCIGVNMEVYCGNSVMPGHTVRRPNIRPVQVSLLHRNAQQT